MHPLRLALLCLLSASSCLLPRAAAAAPFSTNANRLAYLDEDNRFYPHRDFPKLITPQWVGEPGVEAVVILAIDDMRDSKKYETFLRPILERLKKMDGRAPVSIFANVVEPSDPQLQTWLKEGLSLEVHTLAHPRPLLQRGSFTNAWNTYHGSVDLLNKVPGNKPAADAQPSSTASPAAARVEPDADLSQLVATLNVTSPPDVQRAALASLRQQTSLRVAELLIEKWRDLLPASRTEAVALLFSRAEWTQALLGALESGRLTASALGVLQQQQLLAHAEPAIRERAAKLFTATNPERQKVLKDFSAALALAGNPARGAQVFGQCGTCHRYRGGPSVGPDLLTVSARPADAILAAILDPNQAVEPAYAYYIGYTKDNRDVSGIIVSETATSLTLRNAGGVEETVLRATVQELKSSNLSLMPEGFEKTLNAQAMADLIAFLQSSAKKP